MRVPGYPCGRPCGLCSHRFLDDPTNSEALEGRTWAQRRTAARGAFALLGDAARAALLRDVLREGGLPAACRSLAQRKLEDFDEDAPQACGAGRIKTQSVLLTWNGPWGLLPGLHPSLYASDVEKAVQRLREHPAVLFLWKEAQALNDRAVRALRLDKHCVSMELCVRTLAEGAVRVHLHCFWHSGQKLHLRSLRAFAFGGSVPYRSHDGLSTKARGRSVMQAVNAGLCYLQAPKTGSLFSRSSAEAFRDYTVNPEWVTTLWATEKLTAEQAIDQYIKCKKDVQRHVANVEQQQQLQREQLVKRCLEDASRSVQATLRPRKWLAAVDSVWLREQAQVRDRQRFLVLDGPSRTGKTQFAKSLRGAQRTLEVNCASARCEPDLRRFVYGVHEAILFDECHVSMVLCCKKLFQAPPAMVQLASSATNCFSYQICVHRVLLIVCSNGWQRELQDQVPEDREWLEANSVYVHVSEPLWQDI